ncbi:MAG: class I SAM-dependent methyltransferase [Acidimicrobiia bacterium]|jgi:SAM-dependent methyltransferase|nr:class I SAM-dependent methyltransferase [Acidimicrobiia bacterium]
MALDYPDPDRTSVQPAASHGYYGLSRPEMVELVPSGLESLLDVGCGEGAFLDAVRARDPNLRLCGIEQEEAPARRARDRGLDVITGAFPDGIDASERFDCIVFNDVLEHLVDPWGALRAARDLLGDSGCVVASIPNIRNLETLFTLVRHGGWDYSDAGVLDRTHLRFFTRSTIVELFDEAGYEIVSIKGGWPLSDRRSRALRVLSLAAGRSMYRESCFRQFHIVARPVAAPRP